MARTIQQELSYWFRAPNTFGCGIILPAIHTFRAFGPVGAALEALKNA